MYRQYRLSLRIAVLFLAAFSNFVGIIHAADDALRDRLQGSAVRIRYEAREGSEKVVGHGTAFSVDLSRWGFSGPNYFMSAAHNVLNPQGQPFKTVMIESRNPSAPSWSSCRVVAFDKELDLCLVEAKDSVSQQTILAANDPEVGQRLILAGSPRGVPVALYEGTLASFSEDNSERACARIPFDHGCSGGPVFNAKGEVIGIAVAGIKKGGDMDKSVGLFVPLFGITDFLERHRVKQEFSHRKVEVGNMQPSATIRDVERK